MGEAAGHPFRGNQYVTGQSAQYVRSADDRNRYKAPTRVTVLEDLGGENITVMGAFGRNTVARDRLEPAESIEKIAQDYSDRIAHAHANPPQHVGLGHIVTLKMQDDEEIKQVSAAAMKTLTKLGYKKIGSEDRSTGSQRMGNSLSYSGGVKARDTQYAHPKGHKAEVKLRRPKYDDKSVSVHITHDAGWTMNPAKLVG